MANYDVVTRLMADASKFVAGMSQANSAIEKLQKNTGNSMQKIGTAMQGVGKGLTAALTVPILGVGTASVKAFSDYETALIGVAKTTDMSGKTLDDF